MKIIKHVYDDDYGCEERNENEPLMCIVELEDENGKLSEIRVANDFLVSHGLNIGSQWAEIQKNGN